MNPNDDVLKKLDENYQLIPMKDITDEARVLAVRWCENYRPMGSINLKQKHKLASDIMNYAKHYAESLPSKKEGWISVEKDLPELGEKVLVAINYNFVGLCGKLHSNGWSAFYADGQKLLVNDKVTHWQPFPELPHPPTS